MARNFRVSTKEIGKHSLSIQIFGDFDASSAFELTHHIEDNINKFKMVAIDTDGLKNVNPFGVAVFLPRMSSLKKSCAGIEIQGRFSHAFTEI